MKKETKIDFVLCGEAEVATRVKNVNPRDLIDWGSHINLEQVKTVIQTLASPHEAHGREKLYYFVQGLESIEALEVVGRSINLSQLYDMLQFSLKNKEQAWKLFPLFVAVPQDLFSQMLLDISDKQKSSLQQLCASEPIQHHLLLFTHELKKLFETNIEYLQRLQAEIRVIPVLELTNKDLSKVQDCLDSFRVAVLETVHKIENALKLAWNTDNSYLIESLSIEREHFEKFLYRSVGHPKGTAILATGLYQLLQEHLNTVFQNSEGNEVLEDSDPAIEALASLSLRYAEDYWKVALLPKIQDPKELELEHHNISLQTSYRQVVEQQLDRIGLKTVKDFKQHTLVSQSLLRDYIIAHK